MPKKLTIDSLSSEITTVKGLLASARQYDDIVGELQLEHRIEKLTRKFEMLKENSPKDNSASVALFFGGKPVLGSKGIAAEFAGTALEQFQNLIAKTFATNEVGELGARGKIPFKAQSELMVTGLARGSFGFVLDEMSEQIEMESSELTHIIDKATHLLRDTAAQDEAVFESLLEDLDPRTLLALRDFFSNLDSNKATLRVVEKDLDIILDNSAIHRGKIRTEATSIEEKTTEIEGVLVGFLPEHKKFEIRDELGNIIYGSATTEAVDQFEKANEVVIGKQCLLKVTIKTVSPLNRPSREVVRLIEFLHFG
jgi:hypothetical protein